MLGATWSHIGCQAGLQFQALGLMLPNEEQAMAALQAVLSTVRPCWRQMSTEKLLGPLLGPHSTPGLEPSVAGDVVRLRMGCVLQ